MNLRAYRFAYRYATRRLRRMPDFLLIGVPKSATTSIFWDLTTHHQIMAPLTKEVQFFNKNYEKGTDWYRAHFSYARGQHGKITGEATVHYFAGKDIPQRVAETVPDIKLILVLRNPVMRAFSHYKMACRNGDELRTFEEAIRPELEFLRRNADFREIERFTKEVSPTSYILEGLYLNFLRNWLEYFNKERILIFSFEDYSANPGPTMESIAVDFLGVASGHFEQESCLRKMNVGQQAQIDTDTHSILVDFYAPHNEHLYEFIGRDFQWN